MNVETGIYIMGVTTGMGLVGMFVGLWVLLGEKKK